MSTALIVSSVSHYFRARINAIPTNGGVNVLSVSNEGDFAEFLAEGELRHPITQIYPGRAAYQADIRRGGVWRRLRQTLDSLDPRVVVVAGWAAPECLAAIAWAMKKRRRVVMMSESQWEDGPRRRLREAIKRRIVRVCHAALVGGSSHRAYIEALGMPSDRTWEGYDAVDNDHFARGSSTARSSRSQLRTVYNLPQRYFLASGRFIPKKNFRGLMRAYARFCAQMPAGPDLVLLGDGPDRPRIEAEIAGAKLQDRVHLRGFQRYADLPVFYGLADAFVHIALTEQWGLVVNEAAASGLPLIVSRSTGSSRELVKDGLNGYLVDALAEDDVADRMLRLAAADGVTRDAMGHASRGLVVEWGPERFASGLMSAIAAAQNVRIRRQTPIDAALLYALAHHQPKVVS